MAEYSFEASRYKSDSVEVTLHKASFIDDVIHRKPSMLEVHERARGDLAITDMSDLEIEAAKLAIVAFPFECQNAVYIPPGSTSKQYVSTALEGELTARAYLDRYRVFPYQPRNGLLGKGDTFTTIFDSEIRSFHGNLEAVLPLLVDINPEAAKAAKRMSYEILEELRPELLAVHGLTTQTLHRHTNLPINPAAPPATVVGQG